MTQARDAFNAAAQVGLSSFDKRTLDTVILGIKETTDAASSAAGTNTQVQYNNNGDFGASANFTWTSVDDLLTVGGNLKLSATGSAATTDTGIYSPGADQLAISTGGNGRLFVDANGNVGVGASSPSKTLDFVGDAKIVTTSATQNILLGVSSGGIGYKTQVDFGHPTVGARIESERLGANTQSSLSFWTTNSAGVISRALTVDQAGNVGIGTTNVANRLTVVGPATNSAVAYLNGTDAANSSGLLVRAGGTNSGKYIARLQDAAANTRVEVLANGNVGIGTSSPTEKLEIASGNILLNGTDQFIYLSNDSDQWISANAASNYIRFGAGNEERLRITSAGFVGIGTNSPTARFHVYDGVSSIVGNFVSGSNSCTLKLSDVNTTDQVQIYSSGNDLTFRTDLGNYTWRTNNGASEAARIDSAGRLLIGTSSWYTIPDSRFGQPWLSGQQIKFTDNGAYGGLAIISATSTVNQRVADLSLNRQNGNTDYAALSSGSPIGSVTFNGADGSKFVRAASITAFVDGTPGTNDMPGRLVFSTTADGAASPTERMRIKSSGIINFANAPTYASDTAAGAGGLVTGDVYKTADGSGGFNLKIKA